MGATPFPGALRRRVAFLWHLLTRPSSIRGGPPVRWPTLTFADKGVERAFSEWFASQRWSPWVDVLVMVVFTATVAGTGIASSGFSALALGVVTMAALATVGLAAMTCFGSLRTTARGNRILAMTVCGFLGVVVMAAPYAQPWLFRYRVGSGTRTIPELQMQQRDRNFMTVLAASYHVLVLMLFPSLTWRLQNSMTSMVVMAHCCAYLLSAFRVLPTGIGIYYALVDVACASAYWTFLNLASFCAELFKRVEFATLTELEHQKSQTATERARQDVILRTILPEQIATRLLSSKAVELAEGRVIERDVMARTYDSVTVLFIGVQVENESSLTPEQLMPRLGEVFTAIDGLCLKYKAEKIKTIGKIAMVTVGAPNEVEDHAFLACLLAIDCLSLIGSAKARIGLCSGPVTSGVLGKSLPKFDLWGDTVNTASRMLQHGAWGQIQMAKSTADLVKGRIDFTLTLCRGVKGKGDMCTAIISPSPVKADENQHMLNATRTVAGLEISTLRLSPSLFVLGPELPENPKTYTVRDFTGVPRVKAQHKPFNPVTLCFKDADLEQRFAMALNKVYFILSKLGYSIAFPGTLAVLAVSWWTPYIFHSWWVGALGAAKLVEGTMLFLIMFPLRNNPQASGVILYVGNAVLAAAMIVFDQVDIFTIAPPVGVIGFLTYMIYFSMMRFRSSVATVSVFLVPLFACLALRRRGNWELAIVNTFALVCMNAVGEYMAERSFRQRFVAARALEEERDVLTEQREVSRQLLWSLIPPKVLQRLQASPNVVIADTVEDASILVVDVVSFTAMCSQLSAQTIVRMLDDLFGRMDDLVTRFGVTKLKTIGDCYIACGNVVDTCDDHIVKILNLGLAMISLVREFNNDTSHPPIHVRIGVHRGPVVSGVLRTKAFSFDCWGSTIEESERVCAASQPDLVAISRPAIDGLPAPLRSQFTFSQRETTSGGVQCFIVGNSEDAGRSRSCSLTAAAPKFVLGNLPSQVC